ncbi:protein kinase STUNTED isoform X1 [Ricinus communis]|uniref:protein kinase STUNTED isoform X1 n=1 Tax=Ricinus communis TaxID=3988 RepID=UPI00201B08CE|nr:protein kinase STUNTED isoform X1 [Ricinus communis]
MKLIKERTVGAAATVSGGGVRGGEVVVVGVKLDGDSRELLTWTLMKLAKPGDRVIALHVLDSLTGVEFVGGRTSLLSLVKTFDCFLAVYEGFCNLKQVDLKLKVCRGSSVRKTLVREAKSSGAAMLITGTSKKRHKIRSSTSVAKYCARNLSKSFSVFAVSNGKIMFQREATPASVNHFQGNNMSNNFTGVTNANDFAVPDKLNQESQNSSQNNDSSDSPSLLSIAHNSETNSLEESLDDGEVDNSLALVPVQTNEAVTNFNSSVVERSPEYKHGWSILRRVFLPKRRHREESHGKRTSVVKWVFKVPSRNSSSVVYPDQKQVVLSLKDDHSSNFDGENGAIVPMVGPKVAWCPISPLLGSSGLPEELKGLHERYSSSCRLFSYEELCSATSNFMPENLVGKGGSSHVYKGCLPDGKELAVKILKPSEDVLKEFIAEIDIITTLHHNNIISLFGFCFEHNNLLLVYDFLSRGSLEENLHGNKKDGNSFGWQGRFKVAVGVAEALDYLHSFCDQPVIHRDVKSSNILLSDDFEPQLSDFGLASWVSTSSSHMACTDVAGTFGYLAPEYFLHGKVSDKVDVFAFGVVLLELLSGRMPINGENPKGQESLVMWAKPILDGGKVSELLDPHIGTNYNDDQIERMVLAATLCIRRSPRSRPQISLVLKLLQGDDEVKNWARQQVSASEEVEDVEVDEEAIPTNIQSHLNLAFLDLEDEDSLSVSSTEQGISLEDYLQGRWSRTSSFD